MAETINTKPSDQVFYDLGANITRVDTGFVRPGMAACYVVARETAQGGIELAIIETGIARTVPLLLNWLSEEGYQRHQVKYVIPTHVHLDHAGGVGGLMEALPEATLVIHPQGARHMIDPGKLQAGAIAVYGEQVFNETYGVLIPVPESRVVTAPDGFTLSLGTSTLTFYDTPGHARHHFCVHDSLSNGLFTGDTLGIAYPELNIESQPFLFPTTTPVQFDPEAMKASVRRMEALKPAVLFLTHYGPVAMTSALADSLCDQVDDLVQLAESHRLESAEQALNQTLMNSLIHVYRARGGTLPDEAVTRYLKADVGLNVQGLMVWLKRQAR